MNGEENVTVALGRLRIGFAGKNAISEYVQDELIAALPPVSDAPHLKFKFVECPGPDTVQINTVNDFRIGMKDTPQGIAFDLGIRRRKSDFVPGSDLAWKMIDMNCLGLAQLRAKNFIYSLFNWATQIHHLRLSQSFMHASVVTKDGRTLAVLGEGNVGKTMAMLKLCLEDGWRYLSDDLAVIDDKGRIYRSPARLQVYAYNTEGQPELFRRLMRGRGLFDRLQWASRLRLLGPKRVRRRVSAEFLFGDGGVAASGQMTDLVFLERGEVPGYKVHPVMTDEIAARMAPIVMKEIEPYSRVYGERGLSAPGLLPSPAEVADGTRRILECAFQGAAAHLVTAGPDLNPDQLRGILHDLPAASPVPA